MLPEEIAKIKYAKTTLEGALLNLKPLNDAEWDLENKLSNICKSLRTIEWAKLGQQPLPELTSDGSHQEPLPLTTVISVPMVVCSTCMGEKTVIAGDGEKGICPTCNGEGKVPQKKDTPPATEILDQAKAPAKVYNTPKEELSLKDCDPEFLEGILEINSSQSLCEKTPRVLGAFGLKDRDDTKYVCVGSVWNKENKEVAALCYKIVEADKYEGKIIDKYNGDGVFEGLKIIYHDKDYVLAGGEIEFKTVTEEKPVKEKKTRKPRQPKNNPAE